MEDLGNAFRVQLIKKHTYKAQFEANLRKILGCFAKLTL